MLFRYLFLLNEPLSLQNTGEVLPPTTFRCRRVVFDQSGHEQRPDWLNDAVSGATVFATAGTQVNKTPGLLESFLAALRDEPVTLILTIGRDRDPAEFGPQPDHVHIEPYIPESLVLNGCDLVLSHCGSGTLYAALDNGLPMVNVPIGMDQFENAADCERLRVGLTVDPTMRTAEAIRSAVRQVLADPSYRSNAQHVQQEIQALPGPSEVVSVLERLARDKQSFAGSLTHDALA
jgi:MGT family glycosyltransferase